MIREVLGVLERQIDEDAFDRPQHMIESFCNGSAGDRTRLGVSGERFGRAAMQIAGELFE